MRMDRTEIISSKPKRAAPKDAVFSSHSDFYRNSAYASCPQEHRFGGSLGQSVMTATHGPIDMINAAVPELVVVTPLTPMDEFILDVGDGAKRYSKTATNSIVILPALTEFRSFVTNKHSILALSLPHSHLVELLEKAGLRTDPFASRLGQMLQEPAASQLLKAIWQAAKSPHDVDDLLIDGLTLQLLAHLAERDSVSASVTHTSGPKAHFSPALISGLERYVDEHLQTRIRVKDLAELAGMSEFQFVRHFKDAFGVTPYQYVVARRLERAKQLLSNASLSLVQIAYACGYSSQSHMNDQFRNRVGATPGQYRSVRKS